MGPLREVGMDDGKKNEGSKRKDGMIVGFEGGADLVDGSGLMEVALH